MGATGPTGATGPAGATGAAGAAGATGSAGVAGPMGATGATGSQGVAGPAGPSTPERVLAQADGGIVGVASGGLFYHQPWDCLVRYIPGLLVPANAVSAAFTTADCSGSAYAMVGEADSYGADLLPLACVTAWTTPQGGGQMVPLAYKLNTPATSTIINILSRSSTGSTGGCASVNYFTPTLPLTMVGNGVQISEPVRIFTR